MRQSLLGFVILTAFPPWHLQHFDDVKFMPLLKETPVTYFHITLYFISANNKQTCFAAE
jgi:hypothetical protein